MLCWMNILKLEDFYRRKKDYMRCMHLKINLIHITIKSSFGINQHSPNPKTQTKNQNKNNPNQKFNKRTPSNRMPALRPRNKNKNRNRKRNRNRKINKIITATIQYLVQYQQILYQIIILGQKKIIVRKFKEEVVDRMHKLMGKLQNL